MWDLPARVCPECGLGFSPLDYEFIVNSVRFMCPHCRQAYYGTGEKGHLVPRRFACVKCAQVIDEAEMVLLPTVGVSDAQTVGGVVPWRERATRGRLWGFFATIGMAAFVPQRLARFCGERANWTEAWWFGGIAVTAYVILGIGWCGGLMALMQSSRLGIQGNAIDYALIAWEGARMTVLPLVAIVLGTLAWAGAAQLVLKFKNPRPVVWGKTLESFGYAWGAGFLLAVPCVGGTLGALGAVAWVTVSAITQLQVRHEVASGRAVWAGLLLPLLGITAGLAWIAFSFWLVG